ncbi:MAG TPA: hypothetical protein VI279_05575, partial [Rhodocyclaceae bacterium]
MLSANSSLPRKPRQKVAWIFLIASILGLGLSAFIAYTSQEVMRASTPLVREKLPLLEDLGQVERCLLAIQTSNYQYFSYSINRATYLQERQAAEAKFLVSLGRLDRAFPGDMRLISIREAYQNSAKLAPQLDSLMQAKPSEKAALDEPRAVLVEMTLDAGEIKEKLDGVRKVVESSVLEASTSTESHLGLMVKLVVAYSALIFGIAMLVAHHIKARAQAEDELAYSAGHDLVTG